MKWLTVPEWTRVSATPGSLSPGGGSSVGGWPPGARGLSASPALPPLCRACSLWRSRAHSVCRSLCLCRAMPSRVLERLAEQMQVVEAQAAPLRPEPSAASKGSVTLLDYGAGNVRSVRNAIVRCGFEVVEATSPEDVLTAEKLIFPGVGSFGFCMGQLEKSGYSEALKQRIAENRPLLGVCLGMQLFFEESEESPGVAGLGVIPGVVTRFDEGSVESIPHMGWNGARTIRPGSSTLLDGMLDERGYTDKLYFVHSYRAMLSEDNADWVLTMTDYGDASQSFVSSVQKGNVMATQFHPEKSGEVGLKMFNNFLSAAAIVSPPRAVLPLPTAERTVLARRVIACLDVRSNDAGDLVVTKGDQYDVREKDDGGEVRNLGKPVELAGRCVLAASLPVLLLRGHDLTCINSQLL